MKKFEHENVVWEADEQETETHPLVNEGNGKPIILRTFEFELPPGVEMPSNQHIIEAHKSKITAFLWKDELVLIQDLKVVRSKDQKHFRIFATCQPRAGSSIIEKPQLIQDLMRGAKSN